MRTGGRDPMATRRPTTVTRRGGSSGMLAAASVIAVAAAAAACVPLHAVSPPAPCPSAAVRGRSGASQVWCQGCGGGGCRLEPLRGGVEDSGEEQVDFDYLLSLDKDPSKYDYNIWEGQGEVESSEGSSSSYESVQGIPSLKLTPGDSDLGGSIWGNNMMQGQKPWKPRTSGKYAGMPDEETEMCYRVADMDEHKPGAGNRLRHRKQGRKSISKSMTLKKKPHGSRREQQGATVGAMQRLVLECLGATESRTLGTGTGSVLDADMSDVYGRRWFKTPEGLAYLERKRKWEAYIAINETCFNDGLVKGMAPDDYAELKQNYHHKPVVDPETGEKLEIPFSSSTSDDSYGENFDWGWETHLNGTETYWGDAAKWDTNRKMPKLLRSLDKIPQHIYRPMPDKGVRGDEG